MTQQIDPIQIKGLSSKSVDKLNNLANIQTIGNNLELTDDGTLNAVGGGGGGGGGGDIPLYSALGSNTNGALTQKASTDLLVHAKPDGENALIENNKITTGYLPDSVLGQVLYGGGFVPTTGVATLTANAKERLEVSTPTITLTNDTSSPTGYEANEGVYYIATTSGTFASISFQTGDWLISIGTSWSKVDNTDAVTGVKGANEQNYKLGNVNLTAGNVGAVSSTDAVSTSAITPFVTTSMIADGAVTSGKIASDVTAYKTGDTYGVYNLFCNGVTRHGTIDWIRFTVPSFPKTIGQGLTVTFTPSDAYGLEVFGPTGVLFSESSGTAARLSDITIDKASDNALYVSLAISDVTFTNNVAATMKISGTFTFS